MPQVSLIAALCLVEISNSESKNQPQFGSLFFEKPSFEQDIANLLSLDRRSPSWNIWRAIKLCLNYLQPRTSPGLIYLNWIHMDHYLELLRILLQRPVLGVTDLNPLNVLLSWNPTKPFLAYGSLLNWRFQAVEHFLLWL
jgi:hypothetical protein